MIEKYPKAVRVVFKNFPLKGHKYAREAALAAAVKRDRSDGLRAGVRGTPTVFINGKRLHKRNLSGFQARIEKELYRARTGTR